MFSSRNQRLSANFIPRKCSESATKSIQKRPRKYLAIKRNSINRIRFQAKNSNRNEYEAVNKENNQQQIYLV